MATITDIIPELMKPWKVKMTIIGPTKNDCDFKIVGADTEQGLMREVASYWTERQRSLNGKIRRD